jgi:hypothetical protein
VGGTATRHARDMTTLHIQVRINDLSAWKAGYADHADVRARAGVRAESVRHPVDDQSQLVIDLEFGSEAEARSFLDHLRETVWKDQPILAAPPEAVLLEPLST